jgi:hypothetical protein
VIVSKTAKSCKLYRLPLMAMYGSDILPWAKNYYYKYFALAVTFSFK